MNKFRRYALSVIINSSILVPLWAMNNEKEIPIIPSFETKQNKDTFLGAPKSFIKNLLLKKVIDTTKTITNAGQVEYFIYPQQQECFVSWLHVQRFFRNKGYGTQLMKEVIQHAHKEGCSHIRLNARTDYNSPIPFYEKLGFVVISNKNKHGICATLELKLTQQEE